MSEIALDTFYGTLPLSRSCDTSDAPVFLLKMKLTITLVMMGRITVVLEVLQGERIETKSLLAHDLLLHLIEKVE